MEFDSERILKLIHQNEVEDVTAGQSSLDLDYLEKLGGMKLDQLKRERTRLQNENQEIVEQTQDLAISNYKTFIKTAECSRNIQGEFKDTATKLDELMTKLPDFSKKCELFVERSKKITEARRLNTLTLKNNAQLLEILELPQLMNTCIREEKYEEALELSAHVQRVGSKCGNIPVINEIVVAVENSWHTMLKQLLSQLKSDLQLPRCLQIIGFIKRMQAFTEPELKLKFLQLREIWLKDLLADIDGSDPQQHLIRTIEVTRVNLFNIITQYRSIFVEDTSAAVVGRDDAVESNKIFNSWIHNRINDFLRTLEIDLSRGVSSLETVLGQCMYFGLSFSRVGADFRGLMASIFIKTITTKFVDAVSKCTRQFDIDIENYTLINKSASSIRRRKMSSESHDGNQPPDTLLEFQPLALYCNGLLAIFNELRLCAPVAVADAVTRSLQTSLESVARSILVFYRQEQQAFSANERDNFIRLCSCFAYDLVPYIQRCIHFLFPPNVLATNLGINVLQLQKEKLTYLKQKQICEPLEYLLPDKVEAMIVSENKKSVDESVAKESSVADQPVTEVEPATKVEPEESTATVEDSKETSPNVVQDETSTL